MRAIAFLLLGLLALTAARPACAVISPLSSPVFEHPAHKGCADERKRPAHHDCAVTSCVGCALDPARTPLPAVAASRPMVLVAMRVLPLSGLSPVAAIPPPRPIG